MLTRDQGTTHFAQDWWRGLGRSDLWNWICVFHVSIQNIIVLHWFWSVSHYARSLCADGCICSMRPFPEIDNSQMVINPRLKHTAERGWFLIKIALDIQNFENTYYTSWYRFSHSQQHAKMSVSGIFALSQLHALIIKNYLNWKWIHYIMSLETNLWWDEIRTMIIQSFIKEIRMVDLNWRK